MRSCKRKRMERTLSGTFDSTIESISMDPKCSPMRGSYSEISQEFTPLSKIQPQRSQPGAGTTPAGRKLHLPPVQLPFEEHTSASTALELNSLTSSDEEGGEDKENINISTKEFADNFNNEITPFYSSNIRRRCSSFFTPRARRSIHNSKIVQSESLKKKIDMSGEGRLIPLKQGYMFKKSGSSGLFKRKYVILCSDSVMTYYPSFQAYCDNVDGKEIQLGHVTVKIPGRKPSGIKTLGEAASVNDRCDKEDLTEELCVDTPPTPAPLKEYNEQRTATVKRKRLSIEQSVHELTLVSLCGSQWHFQLCSNEELISWELCIKSEILHSLTEKEHVSLDHVRVGVAGNGQCADCGAASPDWASINLGILICIECSGIHRNLGSHISKVRSLDLDSWTTTNVKTLENIGNFKANEYWEASLQKNMKPNSKSTRREKEKFIQSKYVNKSFVAQTKAEVEKLI